MALTRSQPAEASFTDVLSLAFFTLGAVIAT